MIEKIIQTKLKKNLLINFKKKFMFYYLHKYAFSSYKTLSLIDACLKDEINIKDCQLRNILAVKLFLLQLF